MEPPRRSSRFSSPPTGVPESPVVPREGEPGIADGGLLSTRAVVIITISISVAVLAGLAAGVEAGVVVHTSGPAGAVLIGVIVGLATAVTTGIGCAASLHALVRRSD